MSACVSVRGSNRWEVSLFSPSTRPLPQSVAESDTCGWGGSSWGEAGWTDRTQTPDRDGLS